MTAAAEVATTAGCFAVALCVVAALWLATFRKPACVCLRAKKTH